VTEQDVLYQRPAKSGKKLKDLSDPAERRKTLRLAVSAAAEAIDLRTRTRITGRASDLGMNGCYIDTLSPFAVGSAVGVRLTSEGHAFHAKGDVLYAHAGMGMGVFFTELATDQNRMLRDWMAELNGNQVTELTFPETGAQAHEKQPGMENSSGVRDAVEHLVKMLERKSVLASSEARALLADSPNSISEHWRAAILPVFLFQILEAWDGIC
jgi:hypothetical protein